MPDVYRKVLVNEKVFNCLGQLGVGCSFSDLLQQQPSFFAALFMRFDNDYRYFYPIVLFIDADQSRTIYIRVLIYYCLAWYGEECLLLRNHPVSTSAAS